MPSSVIIALVAGGTLNSSAANLSTAVNGVFSGTESLKYCATQRGHRNVSHDREKKRITHTLYGSLESDVNVILNVTLTKNMKIVKDQRSSLQGSK